MTKSTKVLTTSGFLFEEETPKLVLAEDFIRTHDLGFDVYRIEVLNDLWYTHKRNPSHETYMELVDTVYSTLKDVSVEEFFIRGQGSNSSITPLTIHFIEDLLTGRFKLCHQKYSIATSGMKIGLLANVLAGDSLVAKFTAKWKSGGKVGMTTLLSDLIVDEDVFLSFLRYVYID